MSDAFAGNSVQLRLRRLPLEEGPEHEDGVGNVQAAIALGVEERDVPRIRSIPRASKLFREPSLEYTQTFPACFRAIRPLDTRGISDDRDGTIQHAVEFAEP